MTVGDQAVSVNTGGQGVTVALKGLSVRKRWDNWIITGFAGAAGTGVFLPFVQSTTPQHIGFGGLVQYTRNKFVLSGLSSIEGGTRSMIGAGAYKTSRAQLNASAGLLNNQRYMQADGSVQPVRFVNMSAGHSMYFDPFPARGDSVGTSFAAGRFTANANLNESMSRGIRNHGENVGGGVHVNFLTVQSSWYKSGKESFVMTSITEQLRRFNVTENISHAGNQNNVSFGGGYRGNRFSVSVNHSVQFLLNGRGYQQVLAVSVSFRIHDTTISATTVTNPETGKSLWSVGGEQYVQGRGLQLPGNARHGQGKYILAGTCVREDDTPQEGCAIVIGNDYAYSNSRGEFEVRERKNVAALVVVRPEEFAVPGEFEVITAPTEAKPGR